MQREHWKTRLGFIYAAVGSAVGLANIWKFPYIVGQNGGAAFILVYLFCLMCIGFPVFIAEVLVGRISRRNPFGAMRTLGGGRFWAFSGMSILLTGFLVSSFYSVVAGWVLAYLVKALMGSFSALQSPQDAALAHTEILSSPMQTIFYHFVFMLMSLAVLYGGVRKGIEKGASYMTPLLFLLLLGLLFKGLSLPGASNGLKFLLSPDWSSLSPTAIMIALGHSFFTLSVGQGTMITYGSYLSSKENIPFSSFWIAMADSFVSLFAAIIIFTTAFSAGIEPGAGPALIFHTLPFVFGQIPGGDLVAVFFFLLVLIAALTSQISALEPMIAFFIDEKKFSRKSAVLVTTTAAFLVGIPSALSSNVLSNYTFYGLTFFEAMNFVCTSVMIPIGGFLSVFLLGWFFDIHTALSHLRSGCPKKDFSCDWLKLYFYCSLKYISPILIVLVFLKALELI